VRPLFINKWIGGGVKLSLVKTTDTEKWRKEYMSRKGKGNISAEGQELLEDKHIWGNETALHGAIYESRKRERSNEDG
jgi:hypothetical protein